MGRSHVTRWHALFMVPWCPPPPPSTCHPVSCMLVLFSRKTRSFLKARAAFDSRVCALGSPEDCPLRALCHVARDHRRTWVLGSLSKGFSDDYFWDFAGLRTAGSVLTRSPPSGELHCARQAGSPVCCPGFSCCSMGDWLQWLTRGISVTSCIQFLEDNAASHFIRGKCKLLRASAPGQWLQAPWCPPDLWILQRPPSGSGLSVWPAGCLTCLWAGWAIDARAKVLLDFVFCFFFCFVCG